jgi:hypothetical protein
MVSTPTSLSMGKCVERMMIFLYELGVGLPPFGLLTNKLDRFALGFECIPCLGCIGVTIATLGVVLRLVTQFFLELGKLGLNVKMDAVFQLVHDYSPVVSGRIAPTTHAVHGLGEFP